MSRLFITPREVDYIADLTKEITKDVVGQKIYYYHIREDLTDIHDVYEEAPNKVFDPPINIDALVEWQAEEVTSNRFGQEELFPISVYVQARDMLDKEINLQQGDYFSYGSTFFEITSIISDSTVYGEIEHSVGYKLLGTQARQGQINIAPLGPTSESYSNKDAVQETFVQQRGFNRNEEGPTGDVRSLIKQGKVTDPISGPAQVSPVGLARNPDGTVDSAFYSSS
jgi:hypothetical protein